MRGPMRPVRVVRGIQSRRRHKDAPTTLPLRVRRNGEWETISLTYEEYPIILEAFVFSVPRILDPTYTHGTRVRGHWSLLFGPHPNEVKQKLGANEISAPRTYDPQHWRE